MADLVYVIAHEGKGKGGMGINLDALEKGQKISHVSISEPYISEKPEGKYSETRYAVEIENEQGQKAAYSKGSHEFPVLGLTRNNQYAEYDLPDLAANGQNPKIKLTPNQTAMELVKFVDTNNRLPSPEEAQEAVRAAAKHTKEYFDKLIEEHKPKPPEAGSKPHVSTAAGVGSHAIFRDR